jgi:hypothetical protein
VLCLLQTRKADLMTTDHGARTVQVHYCPLLLQPPFDRDIRNLPNLSASVSHSGSLWRYGLHFLFPLWSTIHL